MKRSRFVTPETVRLPLSDGDWIEVKRELSAGESREVTMSVIGKINADGSREPNMQTLGMMGVFQYLVDWSLRDAQDRPVELTLDALKNLRDEDYAEIDRAIDAHIARVAAENDERKKARGEAAALATS